METTCPIKYLHKYFCSLVFFKKLFFDFLRCKKFKTIFKLLRLYALLNKIKRINSKRNVSDNTTHRKLDEEANTNFKINGAFSRLWNRFEFISDLSFHYIITLKKQ